MNRNQFWTRNRNRRNTSSNSTKAAWRTDKQSQDQDAIQVDASMLTIESFYKEDPAAITEILGVSSELSKVRIHEMQEVHLCAPAKVFQYQRDENSKPYVVGVGEAFMDSETGRSSLTGKRCMVIFASAAEPKNRNARTSARNDKFRSRVSEEDHFADAELLNVTRSIRVLHTLSSENGRLVQEPVLYLSVYSTNPDATRSMISIPYGDADQTEAPEELAPAAVIDSSDELEF